VGPVARFANHCCEDITAEVQVWGVPHEVNGHVRIYPTAALFAIADLRAGEEVSRVGHSGWKS